MTGGIGYVMIAPSKHSGQRPLHEISQFGLTAYARKNTTLYGKYEVLTTLLLPRQLPYNILTPTLYQLKYRFKLGIVVVWVGYHFIA